MSNVTQAQDNFRWTILALVSMSHIFGACAQYGINTLAPFYQDDLGLSHAQIGLFFTAFFLGMTSVSFIAGFLSDRLGVRKATLQGHVVVGVFTVSASLAPSFTWAFVSFFIVGLGYSFFNPSSSKGVMEWFNRNERAAAMGIKQTGVPAGGVFTAVLAGPLMLLTGWRGALAILGIINVFYGLLFAWLWRDPAKQRPAAAMASIAGAKAGRPMDFRNLVPASIGTAVLLVGQLVLITYVPLYLKECLGVTAFWASQALAVLQVGAICGRIGWGVASDRLFGGHRKSTLIIIGLLGALLAGILGLMTRETPVFLILMTIFFSGLCLVGYQGVSFALIAELAGASRAGAATGIMLSINSAAAALATPLFGYFIDRTGSYLYAWQTLAAAIALAVLGFAVFLKEPRSLS
ncbi:MAG: MFS transporter [Desulfobacterales bacterium]|jgi:ACS family hexuronate transporter-like MFS transporter